VTCRSQRMSTLQTLLVTDNPTHLLVLVLPVLLANHGHQCVVHARAARLEERAAWGQLVEEEQLLGGSIEGGAGGSRYGGLSDPSGGCEP
jgi:hypothetical protein